MPARLGLTIPLGGPLAEEGQVLARLAEAGTTDVWTAETAGTDVFTPLAVAALGAPTLRLGTAIASVYGRGPATLALHAATLAALAPGRVALGIGASSPAIVEGWNAAAWDRPVARVRDTARFLRRALAGQKVSVDLPTFSVRGFRLERPPEVPPPVLVAALRPAMLAVAGAVGDGAVLNWLSAEDVGRVVPHVLDARAEAEARGEAGDGDGDGPGWAGPAPEVVARIFVCPSDDADAVRAGARRLVASYVTVPAYEAFHRWLGRLELEPVWEAWKAGDRAGATAAVPDAVVDDLVVHGTPERCRAHLDRYVAAGVTTPVVKLLDLGLGRDPVADALSLCPP